MATGAFGLTEKEIQQTRDSFLALSKEEKVRLLEGSPDRDVPATRKYLMILGLHDSSDEVRKAASTFMNWTGADPEFARFILEVLKTETIPMVRGRIMFTLCNFPAQPEVSDALVASLENDTEETVEWIYMHFEAYLDYSPWGKHSKRVYLALIQRKGLSKKLRVWLSKILRNAHHVRDEAVGKLEELKEDPDLEVREAAIVSFKNLDASQRQVTTQGVTLTATAKTWASSLQIDFNISNRLDIPIVIPACAFSYDESGNVYRLERNCFISLQWVDMNLPPLAIALRMPYLSRTHIVKAESLHTVERGESLDQSLRIPFPLFEQNEYPPKRVTGSQVEVNVTGVGLNVNYVALHDGKADSYFLPLLVPRQVLLKAAFPEVVVPVRIPAI